jgi:tRNA (adenine57-N1/adenine58-N1)-methyltransferase
MPWNLTSTHAQAGDIVQLVGTRHKHFIVTLTAGGEFHTHRGIVKFDELIGQPWGTQVFSHTGAPYFMLQPALGDLLIDLPRNTQILYPKDIGYILVTLGIGPGQKVLEAGTGSGSMTIALAHTVGPEGKVITYERRDQMQVLAMKNLKRVGFEERVEFKTGDIGDGFTETDVDALFLDVPNPYDYVGHVRKALKPGGHFCSLLPTANQVSKLLTALRRHRFAFIEVCELMLRYYKPEPQRLRPSDRMVAHTGYLVFARRIEPSEDERARELLAEFNLIETASQEEDVEVAEMDELE